MFSLSELPTAIVYCCKVLYMVFDLFADCTADYVFACVWAFSAREQRVLANGFMLETVHASSTLSC